MLGDFQYTGNPRAEVLFVVEPIITDFNKNPTGALNKKQKDFLARYFKGTSVSFDRIGFLTAAPPTDKNTVDRDKAIGEHLKAHREQFANICKTIKPKFIVAMGKLGARQVMGRAVQITKARGLPFISDDWGVPVLPVLGMNHVMRYPENTEVFKADMETVVRITDDRFKLVYKEKIATEYRWVKDLQFVLDAEPEELVVDVEGVGLDMHDPDSFLLSVQFCWEEGKAYAINIRDLTKMHTKKLLKQLKKLLENPKVKCIGHNLKFDFGMLREKLGITIANYEWDTMVMAHLIDENMLNFSLADLTRRWVPDMAGYSDEFDRDPIHQGKTRMDLVPLDKLLNYGCGDVDATLRLFHRLRDLIEADPYLPNYYNRVLRPGLRAFCDIERYGFAVDKGALKHLETWLRTEQARMYKELVAMVPKQIREDYAQYENRRDPKTGEVTKVRLPLNITRQAFLVGMCFTHPKGLKLKPKVFTDSTKNHPDPSKRVPSVSKKDHFPYFEGNPFIDLMIKYLTNEKLLSTYVGTEDPDKGVLTGFYKYIKNGFIHPSYGFTGTDTGRLSSRDPNGQNFPKRGEGAIRFRRVFVAPPGWVLLSCDLSQIELRGAAYLAQEPTMIRLYREGKDLHAATAAKVMGISIAKFLKLDAKTIKLKRFQAKAVNFGFLYGMWWRKFVSYAKTQYGVDYTDAEAEKIRKDYFELFSGLEEWHRRVERQIMRDGFIRSPFGRIRHLPSVYSDDEGVVKGEIRKGINAPNQSLASDLGVMAIGRLHQAGLDPDKFRVIGFVHDDIICMAREEYVGVAARTLKRYMETNPIKEWFNVDFGMPIVAEAAVGYNLADMAEINEYIKDKTVKTLADIRNRMQKKLDAIPDTEENKKKRDELAAEIKCIAPRGKVRVKRSGAFRRLAIHSYKSTEHAHGKENRHSPKKAAKPLPRRAAA